MPITKRTIDHDLIRKWVVTSGGYPARIEGTEGDLRIGFPDTALEDELERISWEEWLATFESQDLEFVYRDDPGSRYVELVKRQPAAI